MNKKSILKSKIFQSPIVKTPLLFLDDAFWYCFQHGIKDDKRYLSLL